jgi:calcium permeable stress-gated cation channel
MLALLIEERDEILENLEIAEASYISSFRITTPDPSITDFRPPVPPPKDRARPYISRPLPLVPGTRVRFLASVAELIITQLCYREPVGDAL